jgi:hypothetical protein
MRPLSAWSPGIAERLVTPTKVESMTKNTKLAIISILLFVVPAAFACDYPQRASVPNGQAATKDEMIAGQRSVKAYMAAMDEYLACIAADEEVAVAQMDDPTEDELKQRNNMLSKRHNAAVEEMEIIAAEFNTEVRAYKAKAE